MWSWPFNCCAQVRRSKLQCYWQSTIKRVLVNWCSLIPCAESSNTGIICECFCSHQHPWTRHCNLECWLRNLGRPRTYNRFQTNGCRNKKSQRKCIIILAKVLHSLHQRRSFHLMEHSLNSRYWRNGSLNQDIRCWNHQDDRQYSDITQSTYCYGRIRKRDSYRPRKWRSEAIRS
jgi:hypothetical protein